MNPQNNPKPCLVKALAAACTCVLMAGCTIDHPEHNSGTTLEVAVFQGGFGIEWHKQAARQYERLHPGVHINLWGDPRVDEKIKPRVLRGDPPDLANCALPTWKLIVDHKLFPLDATLDSPAYGQPGTWRSAFLPGILSDFSYQGHVYSIPSNFGMWVAWYNRRVFAAHGWKPPKTWSDLLTLCDKIKATGVAPFAFQGKYPTYSWSILLSLYQRLVPWKRWYSIQDLKPGAFLDPQFVHAAALLQNLARNYFQPGCMAMTHTEAQLEWVNGKAAMVFCGLWLAHEEQEALPTGFEMACFPVPTVAGGAGDPSAVYGGGAENFEVFADAKHPELAADFLKYMVSMQTAPSYIEQLDTLSPLRSSADRARLSTDLASAVAVQRASSRTFDDSLGSLYLNFARTTLPGALADLLEAHSTPLEFAQKLERAANEIRTDPDVYKPPPRGVPSGL